MTAHFVLLLTLALVGEIAAAQAKEGRRGREVDQIAGAIMDTEIAGAIMTAEPWRSSLSVCWTDATCRRAMTVAHGGDWNLTAPYDSLPAFKAAYANGADAVKGDFRVSKDNVGVVCHSSPIQVYESLQCAGKKVEDMLAADIEKCKMALTDDTFISVPELLGWAAGKQNVMLCVKRDQDVPRAITTLIEANATDRAFLEVNLNVLLNISASPHAFPGWERVYFLAEMGSAANYARLLAPPPLAVLKRAFTVEFEDETKTKKWPAFNFTDAIDNELHPRGIRSFVASNEYLPTVSNHVSLWNKGFDVIMTYNLANAVRARKQVNAKRGVSPP